MGLFGPEWNSRNITKAKAAIDRLADQAELVRAATKAHYAVVQRMVVEKLTQQSALMNIAKNGSSADVRKAAVWNERLNDKDMLAYIAQNDKDADVRLAAKKRLEKIGDFEYEPKREMRVAEIESMTDPTALANIAKTGHDDFMRAAAMKNPSVADRAEFAHVARYDPDKPLRILAIRRITDAAVLGTLKDACCNKGNHVWCPSTKSHSNEEAMQLYFDGLSIYECIICGIEETRSD